MDAIQLEKKIVVHVNMGWGICFGLDENERIYCVDGCKWHARESDYEGYHPWPSAREYVLDYYENSHAHRELDMIRDECPGTARALAEACPEYIGSAFSAYDRLSDEEKTRRHENKLVELEKALDDAVKDIPAAETTYKEAKARYETVVKNERKFRRRVDQLEQALILLKAEFEMEKALDNLKFARKEKARAKRRVEAEQKFQLSD